MHSALSTHFNCSSKKSIEDLLDNLAEVADAQPGTDPRRAKALKLLEEHEFQDDPSRDNHQQK